MFPKETRILVVDDSTTTKDLLKGILRSLGFTDVQTAHDGQAAVEMIMEADSKSTPFQLIISDCQMPRMDGMQLLNFVRKSTLNPTVPFLMVTAEGENQSVLAAIQAGVNGYVLKPFSPKVIEERLRKAYSVKRVA